MSRPGTIYGLCDPRTGELRYIGKTTQRVERRVTEHMRDYRHRYQNGWMYELRRAGLRPIPVVLDIAPTTDDVNDAERFWIASVRAAGARLLNGTDGGDGCASLSESAREKIRAARARQVFTPEMHEKRAAQLRGRKRDPEIVARATATRRANGHYVFSAERKKKMSDNSGHARPVVCVETGQVFRSSYMASRMMGKSDEAVRMAIRTGNRCGGFHWRRAA